MPITVNYSEANRVLYIRKCLDDSEHHDTNTSPQNLHPKIEGVGFSNRKSEQNYSNDGNKNQRHFIYVYISSPFSFLQSRCFGFTLMLCIFILKVVALTHKAIGWKGLSLCGIPLLLLTTLSRCIPGSVHQWPRSGPLTPTPFFTAVAAHAAASGAARLISDAPQVILFGNQACPPLEYSFLFFHPCWISIFYSSLFLTSSFLPPCVFSSSQHRASFPCVLVCLVFSEAELEGGRRCIIIGASQGSIHLSASIDSSHRGHTHTHKHNQNKQTLHSLRNTQMVKSCLITVLPHV